MSQRISSANFYLEFFRPCFSISLWESETGSANRGTAIVPLSTVGTRYGNSVSTPYASKAMGQLGLNWLTTLENNQRAKLIRKFSIEPASSIRTSIADPVSVDPRLLLNSRKTAGKTPETPEKQSKQLFFGCFGCFSGCFSAVLPWPTRYPFRLFFGCFQCRAFGTSVAGRRDRDSYSFLNPTCFDANLLLIGEVGLQIVLHDCPLIPW